jgi:hypothetical protein
MAIPFFSTKSKIMPDKILNSRSVQGPITYVVRDNDDILNVDTTLGVVTLVFANIRGSGFNLIQKQYYVNDIGNNASINNIILQATGGDQINNNASFPLTTNGASIQVQISSQTEWLASGDTGGITPLPNNPFDFYLDSSALPGGDGTIEKPFKTLTELNNAVLLLNTPDIAYVGNIYPSALGYGGEVVGFLEIAPNLSLVGNVPINTGIICPIHLTALNNPSGCIVQYRQVAFTDILTIDLTNAIFGSVVIQNCQVNINRIDNNFNSYVVIQGGIAGSTISGSVQINGLMFGDVILNDGAIVNATNVYLLGGSFKLNGNSTLKTLSTINPFPGYVDGTVNGSGTPTWITDDASNEVYSGTINKIVLTSSPLTTNFGIYAQTADSTPIIGTNLESTLIGSGLGTLSIPANLFKVGDSFVAKLYGHITCVGTATIQIRIKSGSILLADTGIIALDVTTNKNWTIEVNFTIRSLGVVGSIVSAGLFSYIKNAGLNFEGANFVFLNNTNFDTTIINTLDITAQWNTNNIGNNIYSELFVLNKVY